ncbi:Hypothetical protein CINCED_3A022432 [Cinara cedri]|uniref:Uncharacterized protein n=1 Tax=Cinara cedri TaxID=506608 RepID=A0A5E4M1B2_9HEMI|nr:Hypothetical protein CINCED_3A022432 [Cinara cedri]
MENTIFPKRSDDRDHRKYRDLLDSAVNTVGWFVDRKDALPQGFGKFPRFTSYTSSAMCCAHRYKLRHTDSHILHKTDVVSSVTVHEKMYGNFSTVSHYTLLRDFSTTLYYSPYRSFSAPVHDKMYGNFSAAMHEKIYENFSTALHNTLYRDFWFAMHNEMYGENNCSCGDFSDTIYANLQA